MLKYLSLACFFFLSLLSTAQNFDLINGKEFDEIAKLNPAFTGILEEFRLLSGRSGQLRIGLETKVLKTPNFIGFNFQKDNLENLKRQSLQFNYAGEKELNPNVILKFGANVDFETRTFVRDEDDSAFQFSDFNGNKWDFNFNANNIKPEIEFFDFNVAGGIVFKNLLMGLNVNHISRPDITFQENGSKEQLPFELSLQAAGFLNLSPTLRLFPNLIYSIQGDQNYFAAGLGITQNNFSLNGQYENWGDADRLDIGLLVRYERFLIGISYITEYETGLTQSELTLDDFRLTLNTSLRKRVKKLDPEAFARKFRNFY
jgi:hypothetical protein